MKELAAIAVNALYLLSLINPVSKVSILAGLPADQHDARFQQLAAKSSLVAAGILFGALVRITSLIVMTMGTQMPLDGLDGGMAAHRA